MEIILISVAFANLAVLGAALVYWSRPLSIRYNSWTTIFRVRHPRVCSPVTVQRLELNTTTMTWLFRFLGASFVFLSIWTLLSIWGLTRD